MRNSTSALDLGQIYDLLHRCLEAGPAFSCSCKALLVCVRDCVTELRVCCQVSKGYSGFCKT